jgi:protein TonB
MSPLVKKECGAPVYTAQAMAARVEGKALYKCTVRTDGSLADCKAIKTLPYMDEAIRQALETSCRFEPVTYQGHVQAVSAVIPYVVKAN